MSQKVVSARGNSVSRSTQATRTAADGSPLSAEYWQQFANRSAKRHAKMARRRKLARASRKANAA